MKYKYQFKNKDLAKAVEVIFGEDNVEKILNQQIKDETKIILLTINRPDGIRSTTAIPKEEIERVRAYDPDNWNPHPQIIPPKDGIYIVCLGNGRLSIDSYSTQLNWSCFYKGDIVAFRPLNIEPPTKEELCE